MTWEPNPLCDRFTMTPCRERPEIREDEWCDRCHEVEEGDG